MGFFLSGLANAERGVLSTAFLVAIMLALLAALLSMKTEPETDYYTKARDLWLSECKRGIAVCASQWDDSFTLRQVYFERVQSHSAQTSLRFRNDLTASQKSGMKW